MSADNTKNRATATETATEHGDDAGGDDRSSGPDREERPRYRPRDGRSLESRYRRTMLGSLALGALAALGGLVVPDARRILFAFAGTGLFGGLLAYSLSPTAVVPAAVTDRVSTATAENQRAVADAVGGNRDPVYVPHDGAVPARLHLSGPVDSTRSGDALARGGDETGTTLEPSGGRLFCDFERELHEELGSAPRPLAAQLAAGLVDLFELARAVEPSEVGDGSLTLTVSGSVLNDLDRFDHPVASFLAVGFATGLDRPVRLEVAPGSDETEWLVTCRWPPQGE
ncbi:hypothetical protein [Natrinema versiforme]|uniref:DUF7982 domain-containing protein n=1 Tax=Natrinema versiforme TaxID=88724 RepID=A0A4P8WFV6_9EURY|nr:hypothetical protein [Natrinema versiforme]QCS41944.1 hypothetical protein FEJ81_06080 [Natrinema versiforme]